MGATTNRAVLPPNPQHAVLNKIYPWDEYNLSLVMQWLFAQAQKTGFPGTYEDFTLRYGKYIESNDPQDLYDLIDNYTGPYHVTPLVGIDQRLKTMNKVLNQDVIIDAIPESAIGQYKEYSGRYVVTPMAYLDQILRTQERVLMQNVVIEKIPYTETTNNAGGYTVNIG